MNARGWSYAELARRAGLENKGRASAAERIRAIAEGRSKDPGASVVLKVSGALGVSADYLVFGSHSEPTVPAMLREDMVQTLSRWLHMLADVERNYQPARTRSQMDDWIGNVASGLNDSARPRRFRNRRPAEAAESLNLGAEEEAHLWRLADETATLQEQAERQAQAQQQGDRPDEEPPMPDPDQDRPPETPDK